jgi:hypothetical protein
MKNISIQFRLSAKLYASLKAKTRAKDCTKGLVVRKAIADYNGDTDEENPKALKTENLRVMITADTLANLKAHAFNKQTTISEIVRFALSDYLYKNSVD